MFSSSKLPKVGMRTVKTSIAVMLCIMILRFVSDNSPFYACIAAVVTMQNTVPRSWKVGITRMIGTLIGAVIGIALSVMGIGNVFITGIGVIMVIHITNLFNQNESIGIACIVYLAIMINVGDANPVNYSIMRVFETFFGITVAMIVNGIVVPPMKKNNVTEGELKVEDN